ncbi:MAG TPA: VWA domain-containing protein [Terriglobales bacterium]|nr:VWA domain-containing protein [Terriglobales bacterium]
MYRSGLSTLKQSLALIPLTISLLAGYNDVSLAQTAPDTKGAETTITTSVDEVSLDLVVRDKKNKPVLDLKPEDITLLDSGAPVKLTDLRLVTGASGSDHRVTLVFDRMEPSAAKNAHDIALKILKMVPENGFTFSVMNIGGRLRLYQGFTSDRDQLGKAITNASNGERTDQGNDAAFPEKNLVATAQTGIDLSGATASASDRSLAQIMLATLEDSQRISQDQHAQPSLAGLLALARTQQRLSGRKVVIFFEQGLQLDSNAKDLLRSIAGAANRSGVSIYVVDANALDNSASQGLMATIAIGGQTAANRMNAPLIASQSASGVPASTPAPPPGSIPAGADAADRIETAGLAGYKDPLAAMAAGTGGTYIGGADSLKKPLQQLLDDMTTYYTASYAPAIEEYDGRFRPVVITPRRAGLKIRSRSGYFALPPGNTSGIRPFEAPLLKVLSGPELPTDMKFRSQVVRLGDLPDGNANSLVVEVPLGSLEMVQDANSNLYSVHLSMVAQIKNKTGTVVEHFSEDIPRHGALESMEAARSEAITLQRHFIATPGEYVLESAIFDRNSGKFSAQRSTFEIQKVAAGPSLSDLSLVRRIEPMSAETDLLEPLRYEKTRVVPNLSGQLSPDAKDVSLFFVVHPDAHASEAPTLEMEVLRNGEPVGRMPLQLRKSGGSGAIPYMASIRAGGLPAGSYEAAATLTQDGKTSESRVSFKIDGPELASAATIPETGAAPSTTDSELVSDAKIPTSGLNSGERHRLVITSLPSNTVQEPSPEELQAIVSAARARATGYSTSLPNFSCVEVTDRSIDASGNGKWRHKDSIAELLRYHDKAETRMTLEVNGLRSNSKREDFQKDTISEGEFGGVLNAVFLPASKANFQWKETDALGSGMVQVLSYSVARENSSFGLTDHNNQQITVSFHGLVYIDNATKGVRRITLESDHVPSDFSIHATSMTIDYDYVAIGAHDYLMPIRGTVSTRQGRRRAVLNELEFRDYRRFASKTKISYEGQVVR